MVVFTQVQNTLPSSPRSSDAPCEDLHQEHCGTVGCLVLIQPCAGCVQAQVTHKSDDSRESQSLLNYYMQKGFRVQRMGERGRMWGQISLCCDICSMGWPKWIPFALFPKSTLIAVVIIATFAPQDFVRIYSLTLQVVLNAEKSYGEEILQCRLGGQIDLNRLLWLRHFINVPRTNTILCMNVPLCVCMENWEIWEEISITIHFLLQKNCHIESENSKTISFRNIVFKSYIVWCCEVVWWPLRKHKLTSSSSKDTSFCVLVIDNLFPVLLVWQDGSWKTKFTFCKLKLGFSSF